MIEINLMPGGSAHATRRRRSSAGASPPKAASPWHLAANVPGLATLLVLALLYPGARDRQRVLEDRVTRAMGDSTALAGLISSADQLRAGRDSVAARVQVIRELDQGRYVWSHILDEVAAAMPEFTWLTRIAQAGGGDKVQVEIEGRTANTFALTRFMNRLEASPFLTSVSLVGTEQVAERLPAGAEWVLSAFVLRVSYQPRPTVGNPA
ncbi:MAG: PilN domain-containing protein [Gammaproteobacteria bacterium]|nr:PilN domain-containing protein [Gammaproteobacteria bacterium]